MTVRVMARDADGVRFYHLPSTTCPLFFTA